MDPNDDGDYSEWLDHQLRARTSTATHIFVAVVVSLAIAAILVIVALPIFARPANAAVAQPLVLCSDTYDDTVRKFAALKTPVTEIPADKLTAVIAQAGKIVGSPLTGTITRAFEVVVPGGQMLIGLEEDGCLLPPIIVDGWITPGAPA